MFKILFISNIPWNALKQRPQFLAQLLSQRHEVIFFESPESFPRRLVAGNVSRRLSDRLLLIQNNRLMPFRPIFKGLHFVEVNRAFNERRLSPFLNSGAEVVVITENYMYFDYQRLRRHFNIRKIIYDCVDLLEYFDPAHRAFRLSYEGQLTEAADHIVVVSSELERKFSAFGKKVVRISNGVDFNKFEKTMNLDLEDIREKVRKGFPNILGYTGAVEEWFDFDTVGRLLERHTDTRIVLIGRIGRSVMKKYGLLHRRFGDRIDYLGCVHHDELPFYIKYFDFGTIPFDPGHPVVRGVHPIKLNEYFAMGKSVIANLWDGISGFHDNRKLIDFNTYIDHRIEVEKNLDRKEFEEKIAIARSNDWENKVGGFIRLIEA